MQAQHHDPDGAADTKAICSQCHRIAAGDDRFCRACGAPVEVAAAKDDPWIGKVVGDKYRVQQLAGMGGMARVYRAEQISLGRPVALKVVHPHYTGSEELRQRFYQEARAASALNHPHSVSIIDFGSTEDGDLYLVMEYLQGEDLGAVVEAGGIPTQLRACQIVLDVLSALEEAHAVGVVHRDLKPDNIFIERLRTDRDLVKVVDFGIAKLAEGGSSSVTQSGMVCGTPEYMSPEQVRGVGIDGRSDLYSMGVVLYELLCGNVPFSKTSPGATALCHLHEEPPSLDELAPRQVPDPLQAIVARAMAKEADDRYQSAKEMHRALLDYVESVRVASLNPAASELAITESQEVPKVDAFVGREAELSELHRLLTIAHRRMVCVNVHGPVGVGKSRLMRELAVSAGGAQCVLAMAETHPSTAPVAYWPVRMWMRALWQEDDAGLRAIADGASDPLISAGILEVLDSGGQPAQDSWPRTPVVARALLQAIQDAREDSEQRVLLVLDDAPLVDDCTLQVVRALSTLAVDISMVVAVVSPQPLGDRLPSESQTLALEGLERRTALTNPNWESGVRSVGASERPDMLPLYMEQVQRFEGAVETAGAGLAELIDTRLAQCAPADLLLLQHASVLGVSFSARELGAIAPPGADLQRGVSALVGAAFLQESDEQVAFCHPFIRELVEAAMPAGLRTALHARALTVATEAGAPIEVRAWHAAHASHTQGGSALIDDAGRMAFRRGDAIVARALYRRGWDLIGQASSASEWVDPAAVVTMASGLGRALSATGDGFGAEWLLREQVERCADDSAGRSVLLLSLAQVLIEAGRIDDGVGELNAALEAAKAAGSTEQQAAAHLALSARHEAAGEWNAALSHLLSAHGLTYDDAGTSLQQAAVSLRLGSVMRSLGDLSGAVAALSHADTAAREHGALDVAARALHTLAWAEAERSAGDRARSCCEEGLEAAARAGHLALYEGFAEALRATEGLGRSAPELQRILATF